MASLQDLPSALLQTIVAYFCEPQTTCNFEATCKLFGKIVEESGYWDTLHRRRWSTSRAPKNHFTKSDYKRRHLIDQTTERCLATLTTETSEREEVVKAVTEVMSFGRDCMDVCWKNWQEHKVDEDSDGLEDSHNRDSLVAVCLLRSVHCSVVFEDIQRLCQNSSTDDDDDAGKKLEEFVITSSRMFFDLKHGPSDTTSAWIREQLDDIASMIKERFTKDISTTEKLELLNHVFFDELGFAGNTDDYYDFQNSLLHVALQRRTGIPMTLAIIYKCISRRIGLHVDIIGLPGHIVIGLPELNAYVDVFRRRKTLLTTEDCEKIVNCYGHHMVPEYIQPLTPAQVFRRILNNFGNCLGQAFPPETTKRMAVEAMRAVLINPSNDQIEDCRRWFSQILWGSHSTVILREMSVW